MVSGQQHAQAALYPRERPGTHFTGGWLGPRAGLDGRKISSPPGFDPGPCSQQSVATPTELPGPHTRGHTVGIMSNTVRHALEIISYARSYTVEIMQNTRGHAAGMKFYTRGCTDGIIN